MHHLVVDGVSWRILLEDLATIAAGGEPQPVPTSFRRWATDLLELDRSAELQLWREQLAGAVRPLGTGHSTRRPTPRPPHARTPWRCRAELTAPLLTTVPAAFHGSVNDVLLTALAVAVTRWRGGDEVLVELEGHGREEQVVPGSDLSRTVGWFTSTFPVRLDPGGGDLDTAVKRVKERLRALPDNGIGYGLLADRLNGPAPEVLFNYLGRFAAGDGRTGRPTRSPTRSAPAPTRPCRSGTLLEINALVARRRVHRHPHLAAGRCSTRPRWTAFGAPVARRADRTVRNGRWRAHAVGLPAGRARPGEVDELGAGVADVLPLSPLQEGFYFHAQLDDDDVYAVQQTVELRGEVDPAALRRAAQAVLDRHAPLRASFRAAARRADRPAGHRRGRPCRGARSTATRRRSRRPNARSGSTCARRRCCGSHWSAAPGAPGSC